MNENISDQNAPYDFFFFLFFLILF